MHLKEMIEVAADKVGTQSDLAKTLGVAPDYLTHAKAGRRGLPPMACGKLAEILNLDRWTVLSASELVTEKDEGKREYFRPFVMHTTGYFVTALSALIMTTATTETFADDTFDKSSPTKLPAVSTTYAGIVRQSIDYAYLERWLARCQVTNDGSSEPSTAARVLWHTSSSSVMAVLA